MRRDRRLWRASKSGYLLISSNPTRPSGMIVPPALDAAVKLRPVLDLAPASHRRRRKTAPPANLGVLQLFHDALLDRRQHAGGVRAVMGKREASDVGVDQGRLARPERRVERRFELGQAVNPEALRAARLRVGDIVRIGEIDQPRLMKGRELVELDE